MKKQRGIPDYQGPPAPPPRSGLPSQGLAVKDLVIGRIYLDRLSFIRVLVLEDVRKGPSADDVRVEVETRTKYGWYYAAVWSKHMRMELHDGQLMEGVQ